MALDIKKIVELIILQFFSFKAEELWYPIKPEEVKYIIFLWEA